MIESNKNSEDKDVLDKKLLIGNIKIIADDLGFPTEATEHLAARMDIIAADAESYKSFTKIVADYDASVDIDYPAALEEMKRIAEKTGVHEYTCNMLHFLSLCPKLRERYAERALSDELFVNTMRDLAFKLNESYIVDGVWGTFVPKWYARFFKDFDRFFFTRLQFEPIELKYDCVVDGTELKAGQMALNVHIPRTGTKLDHAEVIESYRQAVEFYKDRFAEGEPILIVCQSWLLFPKHDEVLNENSNMLAFAHDYTPIKTYYFDDYSPLWRTFDKRYTGNPDEMPADTTLRRAYIDWLKKGEPIGSTYGVIIYENFAKKWLEN